MSRCCIRLASAGRLCDLTAHSRFRKNLTRGSGHVTVHANRFVAIPARATRAAAFALLCLLAACGGRPAMLALAPLETDATPERILVATTRAPDADRGTLFGAGRGSELSFADITVSVPNKRLPGSIELPSENPDPAKQFAVVSATADRDAEKFIANINEQLAGLSPQSRSVMVFIHGYNTNFADGVYRNAQMKHDFRLDGPAVHYSWPSGGKLPLYVYDRDSVAFARDGLYRTLKLIGKSNARSILLVGHSMGTLLTMETLRQASLEGDTAMLKKLEAVVLASPDIDVDVFRSQVAAIHPFPNPFIVFVSKRDRALQASSYLGGGHPRVGAGENVEELQKLGISVIDLSNIKDGDGINHTVFASSPTVARLVGSRALQRTIQGSDGAQDPNVLGEGIGAVSDLAAGIIYLPAKVVGVR